MSRIRRISPVGSGWLLLSLLLIAGVPVAQAADADHLIFTEVVTQSRFDDRLGGQLGSEFIEIANPTASDIDLSEVYLTDAVFAPNDVYYWNITAGLPSAQTIGGGTTRDFHVRFPTGYVLAAGDTLAISVAGSDEYLAAYGQLPDFELYEDGDTSDTVPELVAVFPGSVSTGEPFGEIDDLLLPELSQVSESLIMYSWDGTSDLVADIDFIFWGASTNELFDKTGVTVGASTYLADTPPASQVPISLSEAPLLDAYARLNADEGTETVSGGNGVTGHDETSENLGMTWEISDAQNPPQTPAAHFPSAPIITAGSQSPTAPYEGQTATLVVEVVSNSAVTAVDFIYTVDDGAPQTVSGTEQGGSWRATVPGQSLDAVVAWYALATNADGQTATWPVLAPDFATEGWTATEAPNVDQPVKLLITEVATIGSDQEFIEITNPSSAAVDLSNYYLADASYAPDNQFYWRITEGNPGPTTVGGGSFSDFHSRFPDGFSIAAGDTIVVSVAGSSAFYSAFEDLPDFYPDLELWEDDSVPDEIPDMRWVFGDEVNNSIVNRTGANPSSPTLTNGAEMVILYHWDGVSDFVTDIDLFTWKDPSSTTVSFFFDKTDRVVGSHTYLPDTPVPTNDDPQPPGLQTPFPQQADFGFSYQRIDAGEGTQIATGSNGVSGRDETSENLPVTFELAPYDPSRPAGGGGGGGGDEGVVRLIVAPKTFIPGMGEEFPIRFVSKPRSETKLRLFDQEGRLVLTLYDSRFEGTNPSSDPAAPTVIVWDGLDATLQPTRAGMYIVHLSVVNNATGKEEFKTAPVVVATRLSK